MTIALPLVGGFGFVTLQQSLHRCFLLCVGSKMSASHPVWIRAKYRYRHRHHCQHHHHSPSSDFAQLFGSNSRPARDRPTPSPHLFLIDCPRQPLRRRSNLYPMAKCKHETKSHDADNWQGTNAYCMKVTDFRAD